MTWTLIRKLVRDSRWALLAMMFLLFAFQMLWVKATQRVTTVMAPMFQVAATASNKRVEDLEKRLFSGPGRVMQTVIGGDQLKFQRAQDVLSIGYVHPLMQVLFCLWAIGRAAGAIAGEIERGTMELLLAQPVARWRVVAAHLCVDLLFLPAICVSMWAGLALGAHLVGKLEVDAEAIKDTPFAARTVDPETLQLNVSKFGPPLLNVAAFVFACSGATTALSALSRSRWHVIGIAVLVVLVMFIANIIGQIWEVISFLRPLTIFYYYQPQSIALRGVWSVSLEPLGLSWSVPMLLVLVGVGVVGYLTAWRVFARRDLPAPL